MNGSLEGHICSDLSIYGVIQDLYYGNIIKFINDTMTKKYQKKMVKYLDPSKLRHNYSFEARISEFGMGSIKNHIGQNVCDNIVLRYIT